MQIILDNVLKPGSRDDKKIILEIAPFYYGKLKCVISIAALISIYITCIKFRPYDVDLFLLPFDSTNVRIRISIERRARMFLECRECF